MKKAETQHADLRPGVACFDVTGVSIVFGWVPSGLLIRRNADDASLRLCSVGPNALAFSAEL